jgi:dolichol-phosphate mannosyltransferase
MPAPENLTITQAAKPAVAGAPVAPVPLAPRVMVMVPTYNERENLADLIQQLLALPLDVQLLIVDDNSPDGTGKLADEWAARDGRVHVLHRHHEKGRASAGLAGFRAALAQPDVDLIVEMDADFSHDPQDIPRLVALADRYDVVIGSRYVPGGKALHCTPRNVAQSRLINLVNRTLFGLQVRDSSGGFKCYRRHALEEIDLEHFLSTEFSVGLEILVKCKRRGLRMVEVPITFRNRTRGRSKADLHVLLEYPRTLLRLKTRERRG